MDFVHCNICYTQPSSTINRKYCLTSCGHIFCSNCSNTNILKCKICGADCRYQLLNQDVSNDIRFYFMPISNEIKKILKFMTIQLNNCKIYIMEYVPQLESQIDKLKVHCQKQQIVINSYKVQLEKLKRENENLKSIQKGSNSSTSSILFNKFNHSKQQKISPYFQLQNNISGKLSMNSSSTSSHNSVNNQTFSFKCITPSQRNITPPFSVTESPFLPPRYSTPLSPRSNSSWSSSLFKFHK